jgi:hypothetical protein
VSITLNISFSSKSYLPNSWEAIENDVLVELLHEHLQAQRSQTMHKQQDHVKQKAMVFDDEDNNSLSKIMELPTRDSMNHGRKNLSLNLRPSLHVPKLKSKIVIPNESKSPKMHESGVPRASTSTVLLLSKYSTTTPLPISIPPSQNVIIFFYSSIDEMHALNIVLKQL